MNTDKDYEFALQLQAQFFQEDQSTAPVAKVSPVKKQRTKSPNKSSLVDPEWEITDPNPDIFLLFTLFNKRFFWNSLGSVEVKWSPRMTSCAGICTYKGLRGCTISLSLPLLKLRPRKDLVETLLHEMIHAYLFVTHNNKDRDGHGPEFHKHMYRINNEAGTNITVYHSFHDEVRHYKNHVWRCDGPCRSRPPFFGLLRRAMNRAPGPNDFWFESHRLSCGGTYHKISEPEKAQNKRKTTDHEPLSKKTKDKLLQNISNFVSKSSSPKTNLSNSFTTKPVSKVSPNTASQSNIKKYFNGAVGPLSSQNSNGSLSNGGRLNQGGVGQNRIPHTGRLGGNGLPRTGDSNPSQIINRGNSISNNRITPRQTSSGFSTGSSADKSKVTSFPKVGTVNRPTTLSGLASSRPSFNSSGTIGGGSNITGFGSNNSGGGTIVRHGGTVNNVHGFTNLSRPGGSGSSGFKGARGRGGTKMSNRGGTLLERPQVVDKKPNNESTPTTPSTVPPFSGTGYTLSSGPSDRSKSRLLDLYSSKKECDKSSASKSNDNPDIATASKPDVPNHSFRCPVCNKPIDQAMINEHLDECSSLESVMSATEAILIEDSDDDEDAVASGSTVNCPNCNYKGPESSINEHLDRCLSLDYDAFDDDL